MNKTLKIKFSFLNDYTKSCNVPDCFSRYGRFGLDYNGDYFFTATAESQHPRTTKLGFYWALSSDKDTLFVSYRSRVSDIEFIDTKMLQYLIQKIGIINQFKSFVIEK